MINLLPPDYKEEIVYGRKNARTLSWSVALGFGIIVLLMVTMVGRMTILAAKSQAMQQKTQLEQQLETSALKTTEDEYKAFIDSLSKIKKSYNQQILYSRLIQKLGTLLPPGASLTNIALTDKDRAINLNFDNDRANLGPTIQLNLLNQGEQIAQRSRTLTEQAFGLPLGGELKPDANGQLETGIGIDSTTKQLTFFVDANNSSRLDYFSQALKNGGEYAFKLVEKELEANGITDNGGAGSNRPRLAGYLVNTSIRYVDIQLNANSLEEANSVATILKENPYDAFIETYVFEDRNYNKESRCLDPNSKQPTCERICNDGSNDCDGSQSKCEPRSNNGCRYVVRGYYDELYSSATIAKVSDAESRACQGLNARPCTHKVTATYTQLFDKVDINRDASCTVSQTTNESSCAVEARAQFSPDAKFYLLSTSGGTQ